MTALQSRSHKLFSNSFQTPPSSASVISYSLQRAAIVARKLKTCYKHVVAAAGRPSTVQQQVQYVRLRPTSLFLLFVLTQILFLSYDPVLRTSSSSAVSLKAVHVRSLVPLFLNLPGDGPIRQSGGIRSKITRHDTIAVISSGQGWYLTSDGFFF